jgi:ribonuclease Z
MYSHIVFATLKPVQDVPDEALVARTRTTYQGPLIVGRDLMCSRSPIMSRLMRPTAVP